MLQEAFRILLDLVRKNFAALTIPDDDQVKNNNSGIKNISRFSKVGKRNSIGHRDNNIDKNGAIDLTFWQLTKDPDGEAICGLFEIVLPIIGNPAPSSASYRFVTNVMNRGKSLDDSHEPMEIEEISCTGSSAKAVETVAFIGEEENSQDTRDSAECRAGSKPRRILRESKLTKVLGERKTTEEDGEAGKRAKTTLPSRSWKEEATEVQARINNAKRGLRPLAKRANRAKREEREEPEELEETTGREEREKSSLYYFWQMLFFILFPTAVLMACVSMAREEFGSGPCSREINAAETARHLESRVFGQARAVRELGLCLAVNSSGLRLVAIIGGTGVGKSYAAHIISENFPAKRNVFQYAPPLKSRRRFARGAISACGCNLIILENLNGKNLLEAVDFVEYLAEGIDSANHCVLIINVISVRETDSNSKGQLDLAKSTAEIVDIYGERNLRVKVIEFQRLDDEAVDKCILDAAENRNLTLSESEMDDVRISLKISDSGCKGARAKVQLLDKKLGLA